MSLPPALLQRLAQRGLVQKQKEKKTRETAPQPTTEEVIAEDYDEMETDDQNGEEYQCPSHYENTDTTRKRTEDNFWLERMKARMGETVSVAGYKGCPNKYNIWHKCTLYCVNRWADGKTEPSRDYMRRYKRLLRKYPLPKGWMEMYDPGCGCYYFYNTVDSLVSWLPPTHPKSQITKSAAVLRRQLEESAGVGGSDGEEKESDEESSDESSSARHQREIDEIISSSMRPRSPPAMMSSPDYASLQETVNGNNMNPNRKQKSRDLERTISRKRRDREKDHGYERNSSSSSGRRRERDESDTVDPMDPSAYSDTPRGKWSDGLQTANEERKKSNGGEERQRSNKRDKRDKHSDSEDDD
ncbi:uncharacterized protein LOC119669433 [Teleopsis dalmanni]|uniref:uncharacterized protein LOC119669433 n=1 Tax=Teleopsis dalmanni TaxID=139649 RepID=UPI0018CE4AA8|nr:uncharacterized protein LOC119669433 [Teleopsis dalmanni]